MAIVVNLDVMLARRKMRSKELAGAIGITEQNLSLLKSGKVKGVRFATLDKICRHLDCQPGDILAFHPDDEIHPDDEKSQDVSGVGAVERGSHDRAAKAGRGSGD